jgi:PadR family transcriptional regulator PadR
MYMPYMKLQKELVAASSVPMVLSILTEGDNYGYAIIQRVKELSGGKIQWTDGMLYPVLHRLERQGRIKSRWKTAETGRKRKYYSILKEGRAALAESKEQWRVVDETLKLLWSDLHVRT